MKDTGIAIILVTVISGLVFVTACGGGGGGGSSPGPIILISVNSSGVAGSGESEDAAISENGRYVAFVSYADNLVTGDTNDDYDIFLNDTKTGMTSRVSVSTAGTEGIGIGGSNASYYPDISRDGRYVAFEGEPINFVPNDTNSAYDIFLRDTQTPLTTRVSVSTAGTEGNQDSYRPAVSADGRYVVFYSESDDLVPGGPIGTYDIYLRDTQTPLTTRISVSPAGTPGDMDSSDPDMSADGRYIVFESFATNLVAGTSDANKDIYLHDTQTELNTKVSVSSAGTEGNDNSYDAAVSDDGRYVAFYSAATNLVPGDTNNQDDIFLRDVQGGLTTRVSVSTAGTQASSGSWYPDISGDGRYVVWESNADNLVPNDNNTTSDVFVRDTRTGTTSRLSVSAEGIEGNGDSYYPAISADGRYVVFDSSADNLVADTIPPGARQVYRAPVH